LKPPVIGIDLAIDLPFPPLPVPKLAFPALPKLPSLKPPDVGIKLSVSLPIPPLPAPTLAFPALPKIPIVALECPF